jgi:predicted helicase
LAQFRLATLGTGVLGYITSNSYLESPTFRGVRQSLMHTLPHLRIVDLHGNSKRGETASGDENVFEITEGVAIAVGNLQPGLTLRIEHADLVGTRETKYGDLQEKGLLLLNLFNPAGEWLYLARRGESDIVEFERSWKLTSVMPLNNTGIVSKRDGMAYQFDKSTVQKIVEDIYQLSCKDIVLKYPSASWESRDGKVEYVKESVISNGLSDAHFMQCHYRPFDNRWTYYTQKSKGFIAWPVYDVMRHFHAGINLGLSVGRQGQAIDDSNWQVLHVTRQMTDFNFYRRGGNNLFPLWLHSGSEVTANISPAFVAALQSSLGLTSADYHPEDTTALLHAEKIFHYLYAVLHSPAYRQRYAAFLRTDFPRIPIPGSRRVFDALAKLGAELAAWHLLEHPDATAIDANHTTHTGAVKWFGSDFTLNKVAEKSRALAEATVSDGKVGKVFINATSGFANVHESIWQHTIGGYQVLHKWLDDRRKAGRSLSQDDITHWLRVYASFEKTQKLMLQVDVAIEVNGGWPSAFSQNHPPPNVATLAAEQRAQKEQLKAQKKAATATKKRDVQASPTGATSLFDDLEDMTRAAEAPKAKN